MQIKTFFVILTALFLANAGVARAELRDMSFSAQAETARILFMFDQQPDAVKAFITEQGMDVDILGLAGEAAQFSASSSTLLEQVRQIPAPGGVRLRLAMSDSPMEVSAEVFENSVLVTAIFARPVDSASDVLTFVSKPEPETKPAIIVQSPAKPPTPAPSQPKKPEAKPKHHAAVSKPEPKPKPKHKAAPEHHAVSDADAALEADKYSPSGHDGKPAPKRVPLSKPVVGKGMIRQASLRAAGKLSEAQCKASEEAVSEDPWALDNLAQFGACLAREGKTKNAREVFERLLTFDPETVAAYVGLGAIAQDAGETEQARQYYEQALSLGGTDAQAAHARNMLRALE
ncbi:hypothetical protein MNBD_ALPHA06-410 [hydrothermal vent metagenome]|uniref:Uncharacterized protein n=1 Tax=hydrothermal vent metagenome TaxID=652676 RepID=A0A3B0RA98_9ZZZZ